MNPPNQSEKEEKLFIDPKCVSSNAQVSHISSKSVQYCSCYFLFDVDVEFRAEFDEHLHWSECRRFRTYW